MQYVGRLVSSVYNTITPNINPATLSGAIDVIVVERQVEVEVEEENEWGADGEKVKKMIKTTELASTPFHIRFGKMSVLRPAERKVTLHLNNSPDPLPFAMKVGEAGEAFFVLELGEDEANEGIPDDLVTSPIISAASSPIMTGDELDLADDSHQASERVQGEGALSDDEHRAPRKFIEEDYVEPLDLGASRAATTQYLNSDLESNETSTIRSGETRASFDTGITSPSSGGEGGEDVEKKVSSSSRESSLSNASIRDRLENAASKASGAIGAAGRSVIPSLGSISGSNSILERVVSNEQKQDTSVSEAPTGISQQENDEEHSARQFVPTKRAEGVSRLQSDDDDHPPDDVKDAITNTEKLEVQMRDRAETLLTTTVQAREEKREAESSNHGHSRQSSSEQNAKKVVKDLKEESYPAPFGSGNGSTLAATETAPTNQPDHAEFLGGLKLDPVDSGMLGKDSLHPAQVDPRIMRGRLQKWEEEKQHHTSTSTNQKEEDDSGKVEDGDVANKAHARKEDLQYMLDMDGYKMTADGEDLAFAEGNRLSDELPLGKRHGGAGRSGHSEVLSHMKNSKRTSAQKSGEKGTSIRRGSFGDTQAKPNAIERDAHKRRGSHSAATSEAGSFEPGNLTPLLHFDEDSARDTNENERDALNLSRDLVRLTRSLRPSRGAEDDEELPSKWRNARRKQGQEVSLSDTETGEINRSQVGSAAMEITRSSNSRHQRATSEELASRFGDESPPIVRDDVGLGRSPEYEWGWGKMPRKEASSSTQASRRQRVLSSPEMPEDGGLEVNSRSSLGRLASDENDPYKFILELEDASHTFELSLCYVEGLGNVISDSDTAAYGSTSRSNEETSEEDWAYRFEENKVSYQRFLDDEDVVNDERVVIRYKGKFLTWENASAVLATLSLYRKTLSLSLHDGQHDAIDQAAVDAAQQGQRGSVWRRWWNRSKDNADGEMTVPTSNPKSELDVLPRPLDRAHTDSVLDAKATQEAAQAAQSGTTTSSSKPGVPSRSNTDGKRPKTYAKTLRLTSDQLKSLNLRKGANTITFSVTSSYSGVATCSARIFLWDGAHQIVVSDIDGTITKSDALGHVFTMIGRDWTHVGVAKLYTDIARNGYRIMYLTSRAIGQADTTRDYLKGISQNNYKLPDGPVIMSPDRLMASLHREVILRKPEVFKMACLRDIARLFGADPRHAVPQPGNEWPGVNQDSLSAANGPGAGKAHSPADGAATVDAINKSSNNNPHPTPFYAGFGNRITDALSYRSVNIPSSRIFTIDSNGEVKMELLELAGYKSSYIHMTDLVDQMFPPITLKSSQGNEGKPEFNDFNYWRPQISQFELPPDDELMPRPSSPASPALSARSVKSNASIKSGVMGQMHREDSSNSINTEEGGSRLSRFGLGKLGLSRKSSAQTIAATSLSGEEGGRRASIQQSNTLPPSNRSSNDLPLAQTTTTTNTSNHDFSQTPSSPSSYGSGVTSWAAGWRRRAASPGETNRSSMQATSPLVGPVITAEPEDEDSAEEDDDVSSFGDNENDEEGEGGEGTSHQGQNDVLEDDDPLLATGEIQFEWRG